MDNFFHKRVCLRRRVRHRGKRQMRRIMKLIRTAQRKIRQWQRQGYRLLRLLEVRIEERDVIVSTIMTLMPDDGGVVTCR